MEKIFDANDNIKRTGVVMLISNKMDFNQKTYKRQKSTLYIRGTWMAPSAKHLTSAQVMNSLLVSSNPASGSLLSSWGLL